MPRIAGIIASLLAPKAVATTAAVAMIEATDRSSPRTSSTKVWPSTTMPSGAACVSRFCRLLGRRKLGVASPATISKKHGEGEQAPAVGEPRQAEAAAVAAGLAFRSSCVPPPLDIGRDRDDINQALDDPLIEGRDVEEIEEIV